MDENEQTEQTIIITVPVPKSDHIKIKVAAAIQDVSIGEFMRLAGLERVAKQQQNVAQ